MGRLLAIGVLLAQPAGWKPPAVRIQDEGEVQGYASTLNCVGAGISCSVGASVATVNVTGGGGGAASPGGSSGNLQINMVGGFGVYGGTTCSYAVKSLDENGAATCAAAPSIPTPAGSGAELQIRASGTAFATYAGASCPYAISALTASGSATCQPAPTIPADISSAHYVTTQAETGLSAEAVLPTCSGTDKLTFNGTTIACATDQTGGGGAPIAATYITQTPDATLTGEQALSALGTGILKNTTGTGVLSIAAAGTDYVAATSGSAIQKANGSGGLTAASSGTDYAPATNGSSILKGNGAGGFSNAVSGTDYQAPLTLPLSVGNGGTNSAATATAGGVGYGTGTAHAYSAAGTAGQGLYSGGAGAPTWADAPKLVRLTSDYTNATTTLSNTALTWTSPASVSRSAFDCGLMVKSSATTTGGQFDVNVSVAPTAITYELEYVTAAGTAPSTGGTKVFVQAVAIATLLGPAATALTTYTLWRLRGVIVHTASAATVTVRGKAGAAGTLTVSQGSYCSYYVL